MRSTLVFKQTIVLHLLLFTFAMGQVVVYEADGGFPEAQGWDRLVQCMPERTLNGGEFIQTVDPECSPLLEYDVYTRSISEFVDTDFFVEFRLMTTGPSSKFVVVGPTSVDLGSLGPVYYDFVIASDKVRFCWDDEEPCLYPDIEAGIPHTFRLEVRGAVHFAWYIDGIMIDEGIPAGDYPSFSPAMNFQTRSLESTNTTTWSYLRYGVLPTDGSGDFDSDGEVDDNDYYFFEECINNSGPDIDAGPGCRWADMHPGTASPTGGASPLVPDGDVDCDDWEAFEAAWTGPGDPPTLQPCFAGEIPAASTWSVSILTATLLIGGTIVFGRRYHQIDPSTIS